jgi:predicted metal-binding transcription factor (methanogenesis marker protein 9)
MANYGLGNSNAVENVFGDPYSDVSSFNSMQKRELEADKKLSDGLVNYTNVSQTPVGQVRSYVFDCDQIIKKLIQELDDNLLKVNINAYVSLEMEIAHKAVWQDAQKYYNNQQDNENTFTTMEVKSAPDFICYTEYTYAQEHKCRACREFIKQYDIAISHTSFGHLISLKKILNYINTEVSIIKNIVIYYLGEEYKDETEGEIAKHLADWAKAVTHYTKQLAKEITTQPASIPQSELDQVSKKQAAQFQAFFSIRINSISSEINSILGLIKRDCVDLGDMFYNNYLIPAMTFKSKLIEPIMTDINTTSFAKNAPMLTGEMVIASNAVVGNLGSVTTDLVEKRINLGKRMRAYLELLRLKRRYINYIIQLEEFAVQRTVALASPTADDVIKYNEIFDQIYVDNSKRESLRSSHNDLDDLDGNAHPQYLRADGGTIKGDITVENGAKIDGVSLANHSHNFQDGSNPISANSIDYESARQDYYDNVDNKPYSNLILSGFEAVQKIGGGHEYSATFEIEVDDDKISTYDFEILYKEL